MNKICIVSFSRSDYTSLFPVMLAASKDKDIDLEIIAGGSHVLERFGSSINQFKVDGLTVSKVIDFMKPSDNTNEDMAEAYHSLYFEFLKYAKESKPDYIFILGDRWEMLAVSNVAMLLRIPVIHHSGGDITQGSLDNQTRYTLSAQSHIHLVALEEHRRRLIHLGEEPWRVITTGEPALTMLKEYSSEENDPREALGLEPNDKFVLATFHPTANDSKNEEEQINIFIKALLSIKENVIVTAPNPDPGANTLYGKLLKISSDYKHIKLYENLGAKLYYGCMNQAEFMIGNSSSGLWEAPSFKLPVINIGSRQKDRVHSTNVIHSDICYESIINAIQKLDSDSFKSLLSKSSNPYVHEDTIPKILESFKKHINKETLLAKIFLDPLRRKET